MNYFENNQFIEIMSKHTAPDDQRIGWALARSLQDAHRRYNEAKKLIPVYQAAIQHWVDVQREWQNFKRMYHDWEHEDWRQVQFKSTSEIKELKRTLNNMLEECKEAKRYFRKARQNYVEFLEFKKACEGKNE